MCEHLNWIILVSSGFAVNDKVIVILDQEVSKIKKRYAHKLLPLQIHRETIYSNYILCDIASIGEKYGIGGNFQ